MPTLSLGDGITYVTLDILATRLHVPTGTLRRWAVEDNWPTRKIHGRRYYLFTSACSSHTNRGRAHRDTRKRGA